MIPLLATMIAVYCFARLIGLTDEAIRGQRASGEKGIGIWPVYLVAAVLVAILCFQIWQQADEIRRLMTEFRSGQK